MKMLHGLLLFILSLCLFPLPIARHISTSFCFLVVRQLRAALAVKTMKEKLLTSHGWYVYINCFPVNIVSQVVTLSLNSLFCPSSFFHFKLTHMLRTYKFSVSNLYLQHLIDLAGSESSKAETTGIRRKEGSYINKSLLTLGTVRLLSLFSSNHHLCM